MMLTRTYPLVVLSLRTSPLVVLLYEPPARTPALRTYPPVVQHMLSTSYVSLRTQHLSSVSTEHTNLPRSYPHTRVTGYEPSHSYHHVFTTIHEPTRSWHNISWSKFTSMRTNNTHQTTLISLRLEAFAQAIRPVSLKLGSLA